MYRILQKQFNTIQRIKFLDLRMLQIISKCNTAYSIADLKYGSKSIKQTNCESNNRKQYGKLIFGTCQPMKSFQAQTRTTDVCRVVGVTQQFWEVGLIEFCWRILILFMCAWYQEALMQDCNLCCVY